LRPEFSIADLLSSWPREDYEKRGFDMVLVGVGMTEEQAPWRYRSDNLWHFDAECIEDHGSYVAIAKRISPPGFCPEAPASIVRAVDCGLDGVGGVTYRRAPTNGDSHAGYH
jgi:hypothetical protein